MLPVDWFYRYAMKGEYNMGWLNLNNVISLSVLDATGKTKRSFFTGLVPEREVEKKLTLQWIEEQERDTGLVVSIVNQNELLQSRPKVSRRRVDVRR